MSKLASKTQSNGKRTRRVRPGRLRRFLAVDFDSQQMRIVEARAGRKAPRLVKCRAIPMPAGIDLEDAEAVGQFLAGALKSLRFRTLPLMMQVPRGQAVLKPLQLPPGTARDEIAAMVQFQVQGDLPFRNEEGVVDYTLEAELPNGTGQQGVDILAAAVRESILEYYLRIAEIAGVRLARLGLRPYANTRCLEACLPVEPNETVALVHVTADEVEIDVQEGTRLAYSRSGVVKWSPSDPPEQTDQDAHVQAVVQEVTRSFQGYNALRTGEEPGRVDRVFVAGGTGLEDALVEALPESLGIACQKLDPASCLGLKNLPDASAYVSAMGLAYGSHGTGRLPFDFLHPKQPGPRRDPKRAKKNVIVLSAIFGLMIVLSAGWLYLHAKEEQLHALRVERTRESNRYTSIDRLEGRVEDVEEWVDGRIDWLGHFANISQILPGAKEVYINEWDTGLSTKTFDVLNERGKEVSRTARGYFSFTVYARGSEVIDKIIESLRGAGYIPKINKYGQDPDNLFGYVRTANCTVYILASGTVDLKATSPPARPEDDDLSAALNERRRERRGR